MSISYKCKLEGKISKFLDEDRPPGFGLYIEDGKVCTRPDSEIKMGVAPATSDDRIICPAATNGDNNELA